MKYPVRSIKHAADKRAHIPSGEEAGYEAGSQRVTDCPPVAHRPVRACPFCP